jgi:hypothetical protein
VDPGYSGRISRLQIEYEQILRLFIIQISIIRNEHFMKTVAQATGNLVRSLAEEILATLDGIPDDDLNTWLPGASSNGGGEMNTFAAIAIHTASAGAWMLNHQVLGEDVVRDREAEFHATASRAEIEQRYAAWMDEMAAKLAEIESVDLEAAPPTVRKGREDWNRAHWLLHVVDHTGLHLGHLQIHRQLWEAERIGK